MLVAILVASSAFLLARHVQDPWWNWGWPLRAYACLCLVSGGLIWPLTSLGLGMRRRPRGVNGRSDLLDLDEQLGSDAMIGTGKGSWQLRLPGNESFQLLRREWVLYHPGLPQALEDLTIVQLSDLHFAPCFRRALFERVVAACRDWTADLVVITGDLVDADEVIPWIEPVLEPLEARLGKYAILGNHDAEHQPLARSRRTGRCRVRIARGPLVHDGGERCAAGRGRHLGPLGAGACRARCPRPISGSC